MKFIKLRILTVLITAATFSGFLVAVAYAEQQKSKNKNEIQQLNLATSFSNYKESKIREELHQKQEYQEIMIQKRNEYIALLAIQKKEIDAHTKTVEKEVTEVLTKNVTTTTTQSSSNSSAGNNSGSSSKSTTTASPTPKSTPAPTAKPTPRPTKSS